MMHYGTLLGTDTDRWLLYVRRRKRKHFHLLQITETELKSNRVKTLRTINIGTRKYLSRIRDFLTKIKIPVRIQIKFC